MSDKPNIVECQEAISIRVGRFLQSKGFIPADSIGIVIDSLEETESLGILRKNPNSKWWKNLWSLIIIFRVRRQFLGTIWFENELYQADEKKNWIIRVYGREHVESVSRLAFEMGPVFGVQIAVRLVEDRPRLEQFGGDSI